MNDGERDNEWMRAKEIMNEIMNEGARDNEWERMHKDETDK